MALNPGRSNRKLPDMSCDARVPYPNPPSGTDEWVCDKIDLAEHGLQIHLRRIPHGNGDTIDHFAICLDITEAHERYMGHRSTQVVRYDTWHSTVHMHQMYRGSRDEDRTELENLFGGDMEETSRKTIKGCYRKYQDDVTFNFFSHIDTWDREQR